MGQILNSHRIVLDLIGYLGRAYATPAQWYNSPCTHARVGQRTLFAGRERRASSIWKAEAIGTLRRLPFVRARPPCDGDALSLAAAQYQARAACPSPSLPRPTPHHHLRVLAMWST
eukprot:scaffold253237_cov33-Tisochrysis_lutea.AAC.1